MPFVIKLCYRNIIVIIDLKNLNYIEQHCVDDDKKQ